VVCRVPGCSQLFAAKRVRCVRAAHGGARGGASETR
jgi:hypothetical protein